MVNPYLSFNGQCEEAFRCYEKSLGGKITFTMTFGDAPGQDKMPPDWGKKIMHATLTLGDQVLQGSDATPEQYQKPQGISVALDLKEAGEAERVFKTLAEKGTVQMPLAETFFALRFGMLVDRFGIPWMIHCEKPGQGA